MVVPNEKNEKYKKMLGQRASIAVVHNIRRKFFLLTVLNVD
jgi:hypothetical protein